jgi:deoxyribonuclease (pyrimidine dimer)
MTRINCIPPEQLCQQHLVAEYRELPRIFNQVVAAVLRGESYNDVRNPSHYVLGKGHVRFFYPRLGYLAARQISIVAEMKHRGITVNFAPPCRDDYASIPDKWFGDWVPDSTAIALNVARITDRMPAKPIYKGRNNTLVWGREDRPQ